MTCKGLDLPEVWDEGAGAGCLCLCQNVPQGVAVGCGKGDVVSQACVQVTLGHSVLARHRCIAEGTFWKHPWRVSAKDANGKQSFFLSIQSSTCSRTKQPPHLCVAEHFVSKHPNVLQGGLCSSNNIHSSLFSTFTSFHIFLNVSTNI